MRRRVALTLFLAALGACGDGGDPQSPDAAPPAVTLTLGTVDASGAGFFPLTGDQPLVPGAQGGFHVWLKFRVVGLAPQAVLVQRTARRVRDGALILRTQGVVEMGNGDTPWELAAPLPSFMCPTPIGVEVRDEAVRFTVTLRDLADSVTLGQASEEATPRCPDDDQHEFCVRICSG